MEITKQFIAKKPDGKLVVLLMVLNGLEADNEEYYMYYRSEVTYVPRETAFKWIEAANK